MAKKKKSRPGVTKPIEKPVSFSPFKDLKKMLAERTIKHAAASAAKPANPKSATTTSSKPPAAPIDEMALLQEALAGVRPINDSRGTRLPIELQVNHKVVSEDAEVIAQLSDLVSGQGPFDITETEEYVEGMRVGLDPRLVGKLRRGEFAMQSHIDLHGMIQADARQALTDFVIASVRKGLRSILVVHGKGLGSPGGRPILKHAASQWLSHGTIGGHVLAFATARLKDGGAGAMYVLLRRSKHRAPFEILEGAKRR